MGPMALSLGMAVAYRHDGRSGNQFQTYSPDGATLFDFVVVHNGSKLRSGSLAMTTSRSLPVAGGLQRVYIKAGARILLSTIALA